jgi:glycosyltransferase involved in cell wall biosynthesis
MSGCERGDVQRPQGLTLNIPKKMVVLLKGYPRLSETFIAQELRGLERAGFRLELFSMRRPTDKKRHPVHDEIEAPVHYLPEYLHDEPVRVAKALFSAMRRPTFYPVFAGFLKDLVRDFTPNRVRRFGQALVLAWEWPADAQWLHVHFIHTPASVGQYAAQLLGMPWTVSAHAKDIWTSPDWDLSAKLDHAHWTVTCTQGGRDRLRSLSASPLKVHLSYHGLDLSRFPPPARAPATRNGSSATDPIAILSVGRAVPKKGFDILLRALALLPRDLSWRFDHVGGGDELPALRALAEDLGIAANVRWHGSMSQQDVLAQYASADVFALPCRIGKDGDRDGLPNVLVEAASQRILCISTTISGIPELFVDGDNGLLIEPEDPQALAGALERAIRHPAERDRMAKRAEDTVRGHFNHMTSIRELEELFSGAFTQSTASGSIRP